MPDYALFKGFLRSDKALALKLKNFLLSTFLTDLLKRFLNVIWGGGEGEREGGGRERGGYSREVREIRQLKKLYRSYKKN